jgi:hypothetical protein
MGPLIFAEENENDYEKEERRGGAEGLKVLRSPIQLAGIGAEWRENEND